MEDSPEEGESSGSELALATEVGRQDELSGDRIEVAMSEDERQFRQAELVAAIGTHITLAPVFFHHTRGSWVVNVFWGYDYNPANNHLRAYALMDANHGSTHLQAEPLNLGDRNGVLKSKFANSQVGLLETETDFVGCHLPNGVYRSNLHYSIRWPNNVLTSNQQTGRFEAPAPAICW